MTDVRVRVGGAVQYVADLPAGGNDVGDRRIVLEPPAGAESTTYRWDGAAWVPENEPLSGTLRLYVDGTNGDDTAQGTSWAEAWKTYARLESGLAAILAPNPTNLTTIVYVRGDFSVQDLTIAAWLSGSTLLYVVHPIDSWTRTQSGTLAGVAATSFAHGMKEATFAGGVVLGAGDAGKVLLLEDGMGQRVLYQILRVWDNGGTLTATLAITTAFPAWVIAGVTAHIIEPSMSGTGVLKILGGRCTEDGYTGGGVTILGLRCRQARVVGFQGIVNASLWCNTALESTGIWCMSSCDVATAVGVEGTYKVPANLGQEFGLIGSNVSDASYACSYFAATGNAVSVSKGAYVACQGRFVGDVFAASDGSVHAVKSSITSISAQGGHLSVYNTIIRGKSSATYGVLCNHGSEGTVSSGSFLLDDGPVAGLSEGLISVRRNAECRVDSTVDGDNTGTGANLVAVKVYDHGNVQFNGTPSVNLKGKHGFLSVVEGRAKLSGYTHGALAGNGPDMYVEAGDLYIAGNISKSAPNAIGSSIIKARRGARINQVSTGTFTLPAGSGNNTTDYGANGAIDIETCCDVALGLLAGGNAVATNTAVRVKKASRLAHAGAAPTWGGAPLDIGGTGAVAMPAAALSDDAAGTPEDCWVLPGSA
ncbi:MAG: hypothetical protein PHU54_05480 [Candidatus Omnitrophica bacterium]|nr:hypothetical protein [Candidatus Omnitrophota bacterium]